MTKSRQACQNEPFFITDGTPSNDLPIPPHRTMNLPQILAGIAADELARWPDALTGAERRRRYRV